MAEYKQVFPEGVSSSKQLISLVNANNKGYCRAVLSQESIDYFVSTFYEMKDDVNRCYLWRIFSDHVTMGKMDPNRFVVIVSQLVFFETQEQILPFIFDRVSYLNNHGVLNEMGYSALDDLHVCLLAKIRQCGSDKKNESLKSQLVSYLITLCPKDK